MMKCAFGADLPRTTMSTPQLPTRGRSLASTNVTHQGKTTLIARSAPNDSSGSKNQNAGHSESASGPSQNGSHPPPASDVSPNDGGAAFPSGLWEIELLRDDKLDKLTIERWTQAYKQMASDARDIGIPASAIPALPDNPTKEDLRRARDLLNGIIQSFLSSGL